LGRMWKSIRMDVYEPLRFILVGGQMRSSINRPIESIEEFVKLRDYILRYRSPNDLKQFLKDRDMPIPKNKEVLLITWHKSITAAVRLDRRYRQLSKDWLTARGYDSLDDGDLL
jgi:hypothetical protein